MRAVKSRDTAPEKRVASALRHLHIRFRTQANLPGKPDFMLPDLDAILFVQGCFWHGHGCRDSQPKTNQSYWNKKLQGNVRRDRRVRRELNHLGWTVVALWECHIPGAEATTKAVNRAVAI